MEPLTPEQITEQLATHLFGSDAAIVCDDHVSGDGIIETMLASGKWRLSDEVTYCAGKRIRNLERIED